MLLGYYSTSTLKMEAVDFERLKLRYILGDKNKHQA
jgi:hypothetical protein